MHFQYKNSSIGLVFSLRKYLTRRRKIQLLSLFFIMLASGVAEILSLATVVPFLSVLSDPERIMSLNITKKIMLVVGLNNEMSLLLAATIVFLLTAIIASLIRLQNLWMNYHLAAAIGHDLSLEAYRRTLYQPYSVHISRNSSSLIKTTTIQIQSTVMSIEQALNLGTSIILSIALLGTLLFINTSLALLKFIVFGLGYFILSKTAKQRLILNSKLVNQNSDKQIQTLQEGLGSIRDVLLDSRQEWFANKYRDVDWKMRKSLANSNFLAGFPRYMMEGLGLILIAFLGFSLRITNNVSEVIPLLGTIALAAQKLLPVFQQAYNAWARIRSCHSSVEAVIAMVNQPITKIQKYEKKEKPLNINSIEFSSVGFNYSSNKKLILSDINFNLQMGEKIGIVGSTGCGKSTLIDILMGLLVPTKGEVLINGKNLHSRKNLIKLRDWQKLISTVPQNIYLSDCSIAENIAFGVNKNDISIKKVISAAKKAQLHSFIKSMTGGYSAFVGERGIKLSGGQRQRIAIARAFYRNTKIIVMDEATSALDNKTESNLINAISNLNKGFTFIFIAHRISTIKACDCIYEFKNGEIAAFGKYEELINRSESFRELVSKGSANF